jgi:hypothetical protein
MKDYCLRTNTKEEMLDSLLKAGILLKVPSFYSEEIVSNKNYEVHQIGHFILTEPILDENGMILEEATYDDKWHVNIRCMEDLTEEQKKILPIMNPQPTTPKAFFV